MDTHAISIKIAATTCASTASAQMQEVAKAHFANHKPATECTAPLVANVCHMEIMDIANVN